MRYLEEQLLVALAGRAAEELVYGAEELSSLNQHRLMMARQVKECLRLSVARLFLCISCSGLCCRMPEW